MKTLEDKDGLLEKLREYPVVQVACSKAGIGRATYYRWLEDDKRFAKMAKGALRQGVLNINDTAEENLITMVMDKDLSAIKYWLRNHHDDYRSTFTPIFYNGKKK